MLAELHQDEYVDLVDVLGLGVEPLPEILDVVLDAGDDLFVVGEVGQVLEAVGDPVTDGLITDLDDLHGLHLVGEFVLHDVDLAGEPFAEIAIELVVGNDVDSVGFLFLGLFGLGRDASEALLGVVRVAVLGCGFHGWNGFGSDTELYFWDL